MQNSPTNETIENKIALIKNLRVLADQANEAFKGAVYLTDAEQYRKMEADYRAQLFKACDEVNILIEEIRTDRAMAS